MSYDFLMFKPKVEVSAPADLGEATLLKQEPAEVVRALSTLFPSARWRQQSDGGWFGSLDGDDTWYEFRIDAAPSYEWAIRTTHLTRSRKLVPHICNALGLVAFDGQAVALIKPEK